MAVSEGRGGRAFEQLSVCARNPGPSLPRPLPLSRARRPVEDGLKRGRGGLKGFKEWDREAAPRRHQTGAEAGRRGIFVTCPGRNALVFLDPPPSASFISSIHSDFHSPTRFFRLVIRPSHIQVHADYAASGDSLQPPCPSETRWPCGISIDGSTSCPPSHLLPISLGSGASQNKCQK